MTKEQALSVCIMTRSLPIHRSGGLENHSYHLAAGLRQKDFTVYIVTTKLQDQQCSREMKRDIGEMHYLGRGKPGKYSYQTFQQFAHVARRLSKEKQIDIVHSQGFAGLFYKPVGASPKLIVTIHGTLFSETPLYGSFWKALALKDKICSLVRHRNRLLLYPFYLKLLNRADVLMVDSQFTRNELIKTNPLLAAKIRHVPLGVPLEEMPCVDKQKARVKLGWSKTIEFLSVGRLHRMKGFHISLEALSKLKSLDWHYTIIGEGEEKESLTALCRKYDIADKVSFPGYISTETLSSYYAAADVFLFPEQSQPAFGLVLLESLYQGTPVIDNPVGSIPEIVSPELGVTLKQGTVTEWSDTLMKFIMGKEGQKYDSGKIRRIIMDKFSYEKMIQSTIDVYHEVLVTHR